MQEGLTFDMRGAQKAQPFGHPLDGRVRRLWGGQTECLEASQKRKLAFHIAFGSLNIVSEDVKSCPVALRLNCHCFSPFVESQGNACAVRARTAHRAVLVGRRATAIFIAFGAKASLDRGFVARLTSMRGFALRDA
jgi:hypothetical protein